METYEQMKARHQEDVNALPLIFAFGDRQFKEAMEQRGLTVEDTDKVYRFDTGVFYLKTDAPIIRETFERIGREQDEALKAYDFCKQAFLYQMWNHEYAINNYQGNWDVFRDLFGCDYQSNDWDETLYFEEAQLTEDQQRAFYDAKHECYRECEERGI